MLETLFDTIDTVQIDGDDRLFCLRPLEADPALAASIAVIGLTQPLRLQARPDGLYRVVSGFHRLQAAHAAGLNSVPALIFDAAAETLEIFKWRLAEIAHSNPLPPLQVSHAIARLESGWSQSREDIIRTFFPLMRLAPSPKLYALYAPLHQLSLSLQRLLMQDALSLEIAVALAQRPASDQHCFHGVIQCLRLGKNRQREFWLLLTDLERIEKRPLTELMDKNPLAAILAEAVLTPTQKSDQLKSALMHLRYPTYSAAVDRYEKILRRAKLPPGIQLRPAPYFASDQFHLELSFRSARELRRRLRVLETMLEQGLIDEMTGLA